MRPPEFNTDSETAAADKPTASGRHPVRRMLLVLLGFVLLVPLVLAGLVLAGVQTETGTQAIWRLAKRFAPGELSGEVSGSLAEGLRIRNLQYSDAGTRVAIDRIDGRWGVQLSPRKLTIDFLRIGTVDARLPPSPDDDAPPALPASLQLPLALDIRELAIDQVILRDEASDTRLANIRLQAESDGTRHRIGLKQMETPFGNVQANLQLEGLQPYPLQGTASFQGKVQEEAFQVNADLSGTLAALQAKLDAKGSKLAARATIEATPFERIPFSRLQVNADEIDPKTFSATAPEARLSIRADLVPEPGSTSAADLAVSGPVSVTNRDAGRIDAQKIPVQSLTAQVRLDAKRQMLKEFRIDLLGGATVTGRGEVTRNAEEKFGGEFAFDVRRLNLKDLHAALQPTSFAGPVTVALLPGSGDALDAQRVTVALRDNQYRIDLAAHLNERRVQIDNALLEAKDARLAASGEVGLGDAMGYRLAGKLTNFNPALWIEMLPADSGSGKADKTSKSKASPQAVDARINMDFQASGAVKPELQARLAFDVYDSRYANLPMTGKGAVEIAGQRLLPSEANLDIAGNTVSLRGSFGRPQDRMEIHVDAPELGRLGYGLDGALKLDALLRGTMQRPSVETSFAATDLAFGDQRVKRLTGKADIDGAALDKPDALSNAKLAATVDARGIALPDLDLRTLTADLNGTFGNHALGMRMDGTLRKQPLSLTLAAEGAASTQGDAMAWKGTLKTLKNSGVPAFRITRPVAISAAPGKIQVGATQLTLADALIDLQSFVMDERRIATAGAVERLDIAKILQLVRQFTGTEPPIRTDLVLDGRWDLSLGETGRGFVTIQRQRGDLIVGSDRGDVRLGLKALQARADLRGQGLAFTAQADAARIGTVNADGQVGLRPENGMLAVVPDSSLAARATVRVPELKTIGALIGPQVALNGNIGIDLKADGTVGEPVLSGSVRGDALSLTLFDLGIRLRDGIVRIDLSRDLVTLRQVEFRGGDGTLRATGNIQLGEARPGVNATVVADKLQLFASPNRQLVVSGKATAANVAEQLRVDGKFVIDRALFDLPPAAAPKLGSDVVVVDAEGDAFKDHRPEPKQAKKAQDRSATVDGETPSPFAPVAKVVVDLGDDFRFKGSGADLRLIGDITVQTEPGDPVTASGTVRVADGTYEAFGRKLAIERGIVNFQGPLDNPNINILAMRRNEEVEAGVEVTGFAQQPRIKLVSEPAVSDEEKLSWLMFGHGTASAGTGQINAASAALSFLGNQGGKRVAKRIGLDEFSIGASESGLNEQQVVNLGKAISENFTLGYEQSLSGAASIARLTWQLSQRWSLIARAGAINSLNVLFNRRYD